MLEKVKSKIAEFILLRRVNKHQREPSTFNNFVSNSKNILIIVPNVIEEFEQINEITKHLIASGKKIKLLIRESQSSEIVEIKNVKKITYNNTDKSWINLPVKDFRKSKLNKSIDIIIDLNRDTNIFMSAVTALHPAPYKVGFVKKNSDKYYNFQIPDQINTEISYRNLLNSFQMF